ncbi:MAG: hypothetical protein ACW98Y_18465, partial [Candidatus Thorarchaeota archaeon]
VDVPSIVPHFIPIPQEEGFRWPLACMDCGTDDLTQLVSRQDSWTKTIDSKSPDWGQTLKDIGLGLMIGGIPKAVGRLKESGAHRTRIYYVNMGITKTLCKECRKKNKKFENLIEVEVYPKPAANPVYEIKFKNKDYETYFKYFNKGPYLAIIEAR